MKPLAALLLACACSAQAEPWTETQKVLAATYLTAHVIDWGQTRHIARAPDEFMEHNPILGSQPSQAKVNTYFILAPILGYYVLDALPQYRTGILAVASVLEIAVVAHNYRVGIKVDF